MHYPMPLSTCLLTLLVALVSPAQAFEPLSYVWNGSVSRAWNTQTNWTPNGVPSTTDHVTIGAATNAPLLAANASVTNFTLSGGSPDLGGFTLSITGTATFQSGAVSNGALVCTGPTTHFGDPTGAANYGPTIGATLSVNSAAVTFSHTTCTGSVTVTRTGEGGERWRGGNVFSGPVSITHAGGGLLVMGDGSKDVFNGELTLSNTGTGTIYPVYSVASTEFNGNLVVNSTSGAGIYFSAAGAGACQLAAGKSFSVGSLGFSAGTLTLRSFTQLGTTPQTLALTGSARLSLITATFNAPLTVTAPAILLQGSRFQQAATFEQTGSADADTQGGNHFFGPAVFLNSGTGRWTLQYGTADVFEGEVTLSNVGGGSIYPAHGGSNTHFKGNLIVNSTNGSGIVFSGNGGTSQLAEGKSLSVGSLGYSTGYLMLNGFTQLGSTPQALTLSGSAVLVLGSVYGTRSQFYGPVNFRAPGLFLNGAIYHSTATLEKTGDSDDHGYGGNQFEGAATLINSSVNDFFFGGNNSANNTDVFQASVTFSNRGSGLLWLGYGGSRQFNGPVVVNSTAGQGIRMSGTSQLAQGQTLSVGSEGFLAGNLEINHLTQLGSTAQQLGLSGGAGLRLSGCTFGGSVDLIAPALWLDTNTFQGEARLTRSGSMYSDSRGGNTFQGKLTFRNLGGSGYNLATDTDNTIR